MSTYNIEIPYGYTPKLNSPLDSRELMTEQERLIMLAKYAYEGMITYDLTNKCYYRVKEITPDNTIIWQKFEIEHPSYQEINVTSDKGKLITNVQVDQLGHVVSLEVVDADIFYPENMLIPSDKIIESEEKQFVSAQNKVDWYNKEDYLGVPNKDGQVIASTTDGDRYWKDLELGSDVNYIHNQTEASKGWFIEHNLTKYPSIITIDSNGIQVHGKVIYHDLNTIYVAFNETISGKAILN